MNLNSGTKDVCEIYAPSPPPHWVALEGKPLSLSSDGADSCFPKTTDENTALFYKKPAHPVDAFCSLHCCDIFITRAHEFYLAREQRLPILWEFRPRGIKFLAPRRCWSVAVRAKLFAQDDRKEMVRTTRCPQTTLIKKLLRLTTRVGSNTPRPRHMWSCTEENVTGRSTCT